MDISILIGKTLSEVENIDNKEIIFTTTDGEVYKLYHDQDCCERVTVEDICGDLEDLVGNPIVSASGDTNSKEHPLGVNTKDFLQESFTWTFYNISTIKDHVTIRWYGESTGYYSELVDFEKTR